LAQAYATHGVTVALTGRDADRLEGITALCRTAGAEVHTYIGDITEAAALAEWIARIDAIRPLELVIANAGISGGTAGGNEGWAQASKIVATNINGVLNTVLPALNLMQQRGRGQIAMIASLAGYNGMPSAPAYSASKSFVMAYGEALRGQVAHQGVRISTICPGFIKTPLTAVNRFPMPFLWSPERAARHIQRQLRHNPALIAFPWPMRLAVAALRVLPMAWRLALTSRMPKK
jgi:short-subunit dehydrogenase